MKTKVNFLRRVSKIFKRFSRPVGCEGPETRSGNTQTTNIFSDPALDAENHEDEYEHSSVDIQAQPSDEIDLGDGNGVSDYLMFRHRSASSITIPNYRSLPPHIFRTFPYLPEIQSDFPFAVDSHIPTMDENTLSFQYSVATSKIPLGSLFKQSHFRTTKYFWNTVLVPSNPSPVCQDQSFNVQILVPLPSGHSASVDGAMQVGVFYCHRSIITSQSSHLRDIISSEVGSERTGDGVGMDIVTLASPPFFVETVKLALEFMYKTAEKDLLRLDVQSACGALTCSEPFFLYKTAQVLGLSSLVKRVSSELIVQKMLHRIPSEIMGDFTDSIQSLRRNWSNPRDHEVCRCSACAHSAPQVLLFSLENEVNDAFLERAARQTLLESFGIAWCTSEFASLPQQIAESVLDNLLSVITPQNSLSLLFATEEASSALQHSPLPSPSTKRALSMTRKAIEDLILKDPESCFKSPEWAKMSSSSSSQTGTSGDNLVKLRCISESIDRIKQNVDLNDRNLEYLDRLRHLVAELRLTSTYQQSSSNNFSDAHVSLFLNSPVGSSSYQHGQVASRVNPLAFEASPPATRPMSSSIYSTTQGSVESLPYSRASSRTASTDYGLFYTRHGLSPPSSILEAPTTVFTRMAMTSRIPQPRIYQRSPLGIFSSSSPGNAFDLAVTPYSVPVQTQVSSRIDSLPPFSSSQIDSLPPDSSSSKSGDPMSSDSQLPTGSMEQPPKYDLVETQDNSQENERHHAQSSVSMPDRATELSIGDLQTEHQNILQQKILELQRTSAKLQEALVKHEADLKEAVDDLKAYQERTNITEVREQARVLVANQNIRSPAHDSVVRQSAPTITQRESIEEDVGPQRPSEYLANTIENKNSGTTDGEQGTNPRVASPELANSGTQSLDLVMENDETIDLRQSVMEVTTHSEHIVLPGPFVFAFNQSSHVLPSSYVVKRTEAEPKEVLPVAGIENPRPGLSANPTQVEDDSPVDQPEQDITKEFHQLDEYLARFENRLMRYKSTCEERLICHPRRKNSGDTVYGYTDRQEALQQKELVDKLDTVIWRIKDGRKNLTEVCRKICDGYPTPEKRETAEIPSQSQDEQIKILEHVLVSLLRKRSSKKRSPRLTRWRDDNTRTYVTRKSSERKWRSNALR